VALRKCVSRKLDTKAQVRRPYYVPSTRKCLRFAKITIKRQCKHDCKKKKRKRNLKEEKEYDYDDDEVNDLMNRLKGGSNEDDEEDSDNMPAELVEDSREFQDARDGYLAREMWKGYREWIRNRPGEQERFREFMVSSVCCFYNSVSVFY
jgi:hypothetical protein